jgi:hypothetical protein
LLKKITNDFRGFLLPVLKLSYSFEDKDSKNKLPKKSWRRSGIFISVSKKKVIGLED